ncbi:LytR/AlgR family response regulator transcription factor [Spirosoma endophyticum]|uniref:Two component transcriptional regulator, LytTR family n=1 Tax=Spirosoma endophyticum TaxID=662367 RepID=A0A1I2AAQ8_9BACT|nr:response regulator [Spirosoma endophyticum]SFE40869.1 two component transcriptional regulator, LytTR family [Spirosoma endophyticum]
MKKIRVLIIDDERYARMELKRLIAGFPEMELVGEAKNADEAQQLIEDIHPDLLFLDIQMPERSGFDLLQSLEDVPEVIFTTAFDQYAVKAFEVSALDYLLKPIRAERFAQAIAKLNGKAALSIQSRQIFVKDRDQYHFIRWEKVYLVESMDNYARLFYEGKNAWLKRSLNQLVKTLDDAMFICINRAQVVNTNFIQTINTTEHGRLTITLNSGQTLKVSQRQSVQLKKTGKI